MQRPLSSRLVWSTKSIKILKYGQPLKTPADADRELQPAGFSSGSCSHLTQRMLDLHPHLGLFQRYVDIDHYFRRLRNIMNLIASCSSRCILVEGS